MHAFSLLIGSVLGHSWAQTMVSKAQRLVTYFRASHQHWLCFSRQQRIFASRWA